MIPYLFNKVICGVSSTVAALLSRSYTAMELATNV